LSLKVGIIIPVLQKRKWAQIAKQLAKAKANVTKRQELPDFKAVLLAFMFYIDLDI
jgi:hypothetical protein